MKLGMKVGVGPGDIVLAGTQLPLPKKGAQQPPHFSLSLSAYIYCGKTA